MLDLIKIVPWRSLRLKLALFGVILMILFAGFILIKLTAFFFAAVVTVVLLCLTLNAARQLSKIESILINKQHSAISFKSHTLNSCIIGSKTLLYQEVIYLDLKMNAVNNRRTIPIFTDSIEHGSFSDLRLYLLGKLPD